MVAPLLPSYGAADDVSIIATREPVPVDEVPASITVIPGDAIARDHLSSLPELLGRVTGVEGTAGGDSGPASATPAFWGLREFDAFLLVVDDVPWGGAFNPAIADLDLNNTARVEVLKGAAPVMYGATSFVGVVHVTHGSPREARDSGELRYGSFGSIDGSLVMALPTIGGFHQSLAASANRLGFSDPRERVAHAKALYRGELPLGAGALSIDASAAFGRDKPPSPVLYASDVPLALSARDANFNPADARMDGDRYQLKLKYSTETAAGAWTTVASFTRQSIVDTRAFLHPEGDGLADLQDQTRHISDAYFDSHLAMHIGDSLDALVGIDSLYGSATQDTLNSNDAYQLPLDGSVAAPASGSTVPSEAIGLRDTRWFSGQYAQFTWRPSPRWTGLLGLRLNETNEHKSSRAADLQAATQEAEDLARSVVRGTGTIGLTRLLHSSGQGTLGVFVDARMAFKPAALDFGPDYSPELLDPETSRSYEAGIRGTAAPIGLRYEASVFRSDFENLVVPTVTGALANAAAQRLQGAEGELGLDLGRHVVFDASLAWHDSRFLRHVDVEGPTPVDLSGRMLPLAPHWLGGATLAVDAPGGVRASLSARYVGARYLDEGNALRVGGNATYDMGMSWSHAGFVLYLAALNLTDRRPPVAASEFGPSSYYLQPGRRVWLTVRWSPRRPT